MWRLADLQEIDSWMSEGTRLCQYAVEDEDEALAKGGDPSVPGTTINLTSLEYGENVMQQRCSRWKR